MNRYRIIACATAVLFVALWALPFLRSLSLLYHSQEYFPETGSIDASNDVAFSSMLLFSYIISLSAACVVAGLYDRSRSWLLIVPVAILGYSVIEVLRVRPEELIVMFPVMPPWRPAVLSLSATAIALALVYAPRRHFR